MNKKDEKAILNRVYNDDKYKIEATEQPDFKLINRKNGEVFGVEITELYFNQSSARLKNVPSYFKNLIEGNGNPKSYMAKEDINKLIPVKIYFSEKENGPYNFIGQSVIVKPQKNMKFGEVLPYEEYEKLVIDCIVTKSQKANKYNSNLKYIELFIEDKEEYFKLLGPNILKKCLNSQTLKRAVLDSKFIRVYLFSKYDDKLLFVIGENPDINAN